MTSVAPLFLDKFDISISLDLFRFRENYMFWELVRTLKLKCKVNILG